MTGWLLLTVFMLMVLAPFFVRYILLVTERTRRRELKRLSKYEKSILSLEELELLKVNVPKYEWLYRGYLCTLLAVFALFCLTVGALVIKPMITEVTAIYAGLCLLLIGVHQCFIWGLLQKQFRFTTTKLAHDFYKERPNLVRLTAKQWQFRLILARISLVIAIINVGLFIWGVSANGITPGLSTPAPQVTQGRSRVQEKQQLARYEKEVKKLEPQLEKLVSLGSQYPSDFSGLATDRQKTLLAIQAKLVSLEKKGASISNQVDHTSFNLAVGQIRSELGQIQGH